MAISKEDIRYISNLSKLSFNDKEEEKMVRDLNEIIKYIEKKEDVNTDDVDITINTNYIENEYREDEIEESVNVDILYKNAPKMEDDYVIVPKTIE